MKLERIELTPLCEVSFTKEEVELMMKLSALHYDAHCREVGKVGGFLFGLNNRYVLEVPEVVAAVGNTASLSFRQIDTLCKILEQIHVAKTTEAPGHDEEFGLGLRLRGFLEECLLRLSNIAGLYQEVRGSVPC